MLKKSRTVLVIFAVCGLMASCTQQERAKNWGMSAKVELESGKKLVNVTWKEENLWILTRPAAAGEKPTSYEFTENSSWGVLQGKIIINEK